MKCDDTECKMWHFIQLCEIIRRLEIETLRVNEMNGNASFGTYLAE